MALATDNWGGTELHSFAKNAEWQKLYEGVQRNPRGLMQKNQYQLTPMHYAMRYGAPTHIVLDLVELQPAVLTVKNEEGDLPLHTGCEFGMSVNTLLALLKVAPSTAHFVNNENRTPLEIAKSANVFLMGCSWHFYREDYQRVVAALENPSVREALWEAQKVTNFQTVSSVQAVHDVWDRDERKEQAETSRVQKHLKNLDKPQVYIGIPVDPHIRANLEEIRQLHDYD
mmetsp:Transcript_6131/g.18166  ORF Transcript_6131/g.18166 Transcript_6131/m.18166 type:complete len:228 (-) Transcript_6131:236-919(-)|eukprot:CAMPEP_0119568148 /NCGR_PEP_ID=MMETSP1352-20130426/38019_1 /TAXON_ID=265584 /ORGANISM="Stauroneis constricta, Strain CCMP1120" /LENGTH=227 /DNA_ID=CAMNT_0007617495 /DNA_START=294 /DNA_END=977 /DNA_ORIENTATION=-